MKTKKKTGLFSALMLLCMSTIMYAESNPDVDVENVKLNLQAYGHFWAGQVSRGTGTDGDLKKDGMWTEQGYTVVSLQGAYKEHLKIVAGIEVSTYFSWPQLKQYNITKKARYDVAAGPTYMNLTFPGLGISDLDIFIGYFEYKYNPDVKNLGELMFRSATYPAYLVTYFDYPLAKLLGFRLNHQLFENSLSYDVIFNSETEFYPSMDFSLSYLAKYNVLNKGFFEIGAGVSYAHLISVYSDKYDPVLGGNLTDPKQLAGDGGGNAYLTADGDTAFYTFRGTKPMARFSLNPLALFENAYNYFGKEDLKFYVEAIIIGLKNYPDTSLSGIYQPSYNRWQERMPITFGINIPTFKILDVFSLEFEWFNSKYYNDFYEVFITQSLPIAPGRNANLNESPWKWSLYGKKTFFDGHISIIGQMARDHMRLPSALYEKANLREMLIEQGDWWWTTKIAYSF